MRLLWRDQLRKFISRPLGTLAVATMFALITATFVFVQVTAARLEAPIEPYFESQNAENFHVSLGPIDARALTASQFSTLCQALGDIDACFGIDQSDAEAMNRISLQFQALAQRDPSVYDTIYEPYLLPLIEQYDFLIERGIFTTMQDGEHLFRFISINETVNKPVITEGTLPERMGEIAILEPFAKANDVTIGDTMRIGNRTWRITGYFMAPNYVLPILEKHQPIFDASTQSLVLTTEVSLRNIARPHTVVYHIKGDPSVLGDDFAVTETLSANLHHFGRSLSMIRTAIPRDYNIRMHTPSFEANSATVFSNVYLLSFSVMALGVAALVFQQTLLKQHHDINTIKALGHTKKHASLALAFPGIIIGKGIALGFLIGLMISAWFFDDYTARYFMPKSPMQVPIETIVFTLFMMVVPYVLFILISLRHLNKTIRPSASKTIRAAKNAFVFMLIGWVMILSVASRSLIDDFTETTLEGIHYENLVILNGYTDTPPEHVEPFSANQLSLRAINEERLPSDIRIQGYGLPLNTTLKRLNNDDIASNALLKEGVYVTRPLAEQKNLQVNDQLTLTLGAVQRDFTIVGIHNDLIEHAVYMDHESLNAMSGFDATMYNAYYTNAPVVETAETSLIANPNAIAESFRTLFRLSSIVLYALMGFATIIAMAMFAGVIINTMATEQQSMAMLKALGYKDYETYGVFFKTITIALSIAFILGGALAVLTLRFILNYLSNYFGFVFIGNVSITNLFISFGVALSIAFITMMAVIKMSAKTALATTLKNR